MSLILKFHPHWAVAILFLSLIIAAIPAFRVQLPPQFIIDAPSTHLPAFLQESKRPRCAVSAWEGNAFSPTQIRLLSNSFAVNMEEKHLNQHGDVTWLLDKA